MSYQRVIPRDLFNEASLLKCYGALYIALDDMGCKDAFFENEDVESFDIDQRLDDGSLFITNLPLIVHGVHCTLVRPLNSRRSYPLYLESESNPDAEPIAVFEDDGKLSAAMLKFIGDAP